MSKAQRSDAEPVVEPRSVSDDVSVPLFSVWRQDDNGNEVVIRSGLARAEAEKLAGEFEARGHRQLYSVRPDPPR